MNKRADSYTWIGIDKPYIALNPDTYISIQTEELRMCKRIGYEYYCEELFVVKSKSKYSCTSVLYFQLDKQTIKDNCILDYYYNKTDVKQSILDGGHEIVLANWPSFKRIVCSTYNNIPIEIPRHPYVLLNRTILCNCIIEVENNFLLESIAACDPDDDGADLEMYFVANTAFFNYFKELINTLEAPFLHNIMMQEHILPIFLELDDFDKELLAAPETLRELVEKYKKRKLNFDIQHETLDTEDDRAIETSIFNHLASKIFIFTMAIIALIIVLIVIMLIFKGEKMQALVTNLAMIKGVKALMEETKIGNNYEYWIIIAWLTLILMGVMCLTIEKLYKMPIFGKYQYSNMIKIMIFFSNIKSYVPIKLCKTSGSIHLFKLTGSLNRENVTLHRNTIWHILDIDWQNITVTLNGSVVNLPGLVIIPFREKFKIRQTIESKPLLMHLMLKQGQTWYPLSNIREIMEIEDNAPESIEMCIGS